MLLDLAEDVEFFHTADDVAYARIERDGHHEVWPLGSKSLRAWLSRQFHLEYGRAAGGQALKDALDVLMGRALYEGPACPVYVRVAGDGNDIYLDLGDPLWQAVKITAMNGSSSKGRASSAFASHRPRTGTDWRSLCQRLLWRARQELSLGMPTQDSGRF